MANKIILKKSSVGNKIPLDTDLVFGELALNYTDGKLYYKNSDNAIDFINNGGTFTNALIITSTTNSASTTTGALVVTGGVGIGGNLYTGGLLNVAGNTTINGALLANELRNRSGQQLVLNAGESHSAATGQNGELVYINAESGLEINSSPDNWVSGWANRYTTSIGDSSGNSSFPGAVSINGTTVSVSTTTGALKVTGGVGIGGDLYVGGKGSLGTAAATTPQLVVTGGSAGTDIIQLVRTSGTTLTYGWSLSGGKLSFRNVTANAITFQTSYGSVIASTAEINVGQDYSGTTVGDNGLIKGSDSGTASTDTNGGNLTIASGRGTGAAISSKLFFQTPVVGASGTSRQTLSTRMTIDDIGVGINTTSPTTSLDVLGGTRITGVTTITNTTNASSTITGALQIIGGVGIGGDLYVGGNIAANLTGVSTTATNIAGGTTNQLPIQSSPGNTTFINTSSLYVGRSITSDSVNEVFLTTSTNTILNTFTTFVFASGEITLSLPSAIEIPSKKYNIRNNGINSITVIPTIGQTINGYTNMTITETNSVMGLLSDGANWVIF